ncbi:probable serine/threonine-protein kinase kinX [Aphidius gifuensis]|uniref:probable serine/threonine-protein kinase kinX n=1 Tax=Aphidius gifuensis TaxID=684658 RepID=UPI001CDD3C57|nr:probable serine/threonine-protein kinase kinX [Aphidius gifuensis]XP_044004138.1 probable serine/threonine-protein kinase kinX [Aphidius gifuensis]
MADKSQLKKKNILKINQCVNNSLNCLSLENNESNAPSKITLKNKDQFSSRISTLPRLLNTQKQIIHGLRNIKYDELLFDNKKLGSGAQVWSGEWIGQPVAIKKIRVMQHNVNTIEREIDVLKLVYHPNIVQTLGFCYHQRIIYIVMEIVQGHSLELILFKDKYKKLYNLNEKDKDNIVIQLSQALSYIHHGDVQIVHGDIKPGNILITSNLTVKLCDFGMSKLYQYAETVTGYSVVGNTLGGTYAYMPPEMITHRQKKPTVASDIWAFGCTVLEIYNEKILFPNDLDAIEEMHQQDIAIHATKVPKAIRETVISYFSHEPGERPKCELLYNFFDLKKNEWKSKEKIREIAIRESLL